MQWGHRLICLVVAIAFSLTVVPIPTEKHSEKDLSQPFPCQFRACGCRNAGQCWKTCCCFSNAQKVAWAKKHRVQLPQFVALAAKSEQSQSLPRASETATSHIGATHVNPESTAKTNIKSLLPGAGRAAIKNTATSTETNRDDLHGRSSSVAVAHSCSNTEAAPQLSADNSVVPSSASKTAGMSNSCCGHRVRHLASTPDQASTPSQHSVTAQDATAAPQPRFLLGIFASRCQGGEQFWNAIPWGIIVHLETSPLRSTELARHLPLGSEHGHHFSIRPPVPPPRQA